jgi:glycine cleavage system H lipoate-binding protein
MFPGVYGFTWDAGNLIFLGLFFTVAVVIVTTVSVAALRSHRDLRQGKEEAIRWHEDFSNLPVPLRACRHELSGQSQHRLCTRGFDCRQCTFHSRLVANDDRSAEHEWYHRGHTCVRREPDGSYLVSLTDFGRKIFGTPDEITLPSAGTRLQVHGTGWTMRRQGNEVRVLSPIDGMVIARGGPDQGWYLKVAPLGEQSPTTHLLTEREAGAWRVREVERLQILLGGNSAPTLADGGELMDDLPSCYPDADWDDVWGQMFLEG